MTTINVDPEELRTHAGSIEELIAVFDEAKGASSHIALGDESYGLLCAWIPPLMSAKHERFDALLEQGRGLFESTAESLRSTADWYETTDGNNSTGIDGAGDPIETTVIV
ncbi:type VII secretion target [Stackebrandtia soli]|uniref:type VII secretion target n=1 Tax=Stackebrandtia soli TaxID=1892856 RepID=UPI0039ED4DCB